MQSRRMAPIYIIASLVLASGCSNESPAAQEDPGDAVGGTASASAEATEPGLASDQSGQTGSASCRLEGLAGGSATLEATPTGLVMAFDGLPVPESGGALFSVSVYDAQGGNGAQLGVKYLDGEQTAFFVFDTGEARQTNLDSMATVTSTGVTAEFSRVELGSLGAEIGKWSASYSLDGADVGLCPADYSTLPFPA